MAEHAHDEEHGALGHVLPVRILAGVFIALLFLTVITVLVAKVDFGNHSINLAIAMLIATIKASLVVLYFMHLRYDRLFHSIILISALLGAFLFVGFALVDRGQYEQDVKWDDKNPPALERPKPPITPIDL